jgi:hypothetical protein
MLELIKRLEERRTAAYPLLYSADFSYDRLEYRSYNTWLDGKERSKAPGWLKSQLL